MIQTVNAIYCYVEVELVELYQIVFSLRFFPCAHKRTASLKGNSLTGGPSTTILIIESRVLSFIRFLKAVLTNFS